MYDLLSDTIASNYPDLIDSFEQIKQIKWDKVYYQKASTVKGKKRKVGKKKLNDFDKDFLTIQKILVVLGTYINVENVDLQEIMHVNIDAVNYDELITNIKWKKKEDCKEFFEDFDKLCEKVFTQICKLDNSDYSIRKNVRRLFHETILELGTQHKLNIPLDKVWTTADDIERGIMMYTLLMVTEQSQGDMRAISWDDILLKNIYLTKSNCVLSSLTNEKYNLELVKMVLSSTVYPIELAFMKRSQLLSRRFEDLETNKLKIYEESGISQGDDDYTKYFSNVRCPKCKLNHTSFSQLQTRSADEPMTIFWYCHKCKINGRQ